jgi:hypothetical protein
MVNEHELSYYTSMDLREQFIKVKERIGDNFGSLTLTFDNRLDFQFTIHVHVFGESRNIIRAYPGDTPQEAFESLLDTLDEEEAAGLGWPWWSTAHSDRETRRIMKEVSERHGFNDRKEK